MSERAGVAPDVGIFRKIETMSMVSCFQSGPAWSQVKRPLNSSIEDCCARSVGDDPYPEIEDVHSSRIEDCAPMRMASLHS